MNQQDNHEANTAKSLTDLELTNEQAQQTKGGALHRGGPGDDLLIGGLTNFDDDAGR